ncbi:uncharacterized protein GLRG_02918 [Colletotrichum graminicola M1.001]|uniref:Uncharacterized protein n=1 Tax=Colletotrichum graminicola (strain M1.001 / M2 / FGSC 10212) TaxID=645133 RepID=E3QA86_COLGM|nr:uncharacterized protein GLRG_02918 [Colletotrichum graminicola M1.001]EFQ27774.1 hypothetical protein GLRG_02918 [Colletotrichum graminicola M1.001]
MGRGVDDGLQRYNSQATIHTGLDIIIGILHQGYPPRQPLREGRWVISAQEENKTVLSTLGNQRSEATDELSAKQGLFSSIWPRSPPPH